MEPSNYYDYESNNSSSQRPQHTQFLDLTNGEGGERRQGVAMPYRDGSYLPSNSTSNPNRAIAGPLTSLRASTTFPRAGSGDDTSNFGKIDPNTPGRVVETGQEQTGRWTKEEHEAFLKGLKLYGKEWKKVAAKVKTRTVVQTRTHAQKYFQKLAKANEGKDDVTQVDMGTASDARRGGSSVKKKRLNVSTSNKVSRTASVTSAAQVISTLSGQHALPLSRPMDVSTQNHGFQTATGTGNGHKVMAGNNIYQPTHGFSSSFANASVSEARPASIPSSSARDAMLGGNSYLRGKTSSIGTSSFPSMKIVAPAHDSAIKRGKFPEPSPAACGKRKLAEIAAARMLAGVAASESLLTPSQSQLNDGSKRSGQSMSHHIHDQLGNNEDGTATPPLQERNIGSQAAASFQSATALTAQSSMARKDNDTTNGSSRFAARKPMGLSLQIVNPESLGISHEEIVGRKRQGENSPVTPWEGQLQALVR